MCLHDFIRVLLEWDTISKAEMVLSQHDWKIVDRDVKNMRTKSTHESICISLQSEQYLLPVDFKTTPEEQEYNRIELNYYYYYYYYYYYFIIIIQFCVPFKIISAHMRRANQ